MKNKTIIFISNNLLILSYVILVSIDIITTLQYVGVNGIIEINPITVVLIKNPLLFISLLIGNIILFVFINFFIYFKTKYNDILRFFLIILIINNLIGFSVLVNNYYVFIRCI